MQKLEKISNRCWYQTPVLETDRPILGVVVGDNRSLMIDAGNSEAHANYFLKELKEHGIPLPSIVVLTHWHWDHIFGLSALNMLSVASIQTKAKIEKLVSYEWTDSALEERVKSGLEIEFCANAIKKEFGSERNIIISLPDLAFDQRIELDIGGVSCLLQHVGGDHSPDSIVVYIKEEKILFLGDSIYADIYSNKRNYTTQRTIQLLDTIDQFDAEIYVLSHWKPISKDEYQQEAMLLRTVATLTDQYEGRFEDIKKSYQLQLNRELNEEELETIGYFVKGFELNK
ncbi:MBL fold metallo-hydrolase [Bacillus sp. ISL-4]|uniref:MBL fold metallo-hydrolase n=1 Tax=Bacillus sp. ISL-4 TaxID=2819125 RepID=UPI001BEB1A96|nr:MBL fold metallo-hydrolase [Bacillus sp. ISL-4]MBT2668835.1 MBL fold metallo-hydrolase [Bacillus sp. ISL-4]MBT2669416.1 MBL fold metallo-hydrolase [Streptomyces sp. ISL-14]